MNLRMPFLLQAGRAALSLRLDGPPSGAILPLGAEEGRFAGDEAGFQLKDI